MNRKHNRRTGRRIAGRWDPNTPTILTGVLLLLILGSIAGAVIKIRGGPTSDAPFETTSAASDPSGPGPGETSGPEKEETPKPEPEPSAPTEEELPAARAEKILSEMSLEEKVWQMMIVYPEAIINVYPVTDAGNTTRQALEDCPVGGFLYDRKNLLSRSQVAEMLANVQTFSKIPLILTCDEEGGRVNRLMSAVGTTWIGPMLDYKDEGPGTAFSNAETIARDLLSCGFNTDLAPVADVWSNPQNTVIGDRAYSDDFQQAAQLVAAAVEGFHAGGSACTLKHFPGHGNTSADSHYGAVYVERTLEELRTGELLPFQAGIDAGADAVMIGHLIVSDIDNEPAPFSYKIVTGLLREEMGFDGVVMTDGLQMQAMTDHYSSAEIAVKAVKAGVDILLCPLDVKAAVRAVTDAVDSGEITEQRLDESVRRILTMKLKNGMFAVQPEA